MELGFGEMLVIALVIVVLFGPDKLPGIARELGQGVRKMKSAMEDIKSEVMKETDNPLTEIKKEIDKVKESVKEEKMFADMKHEIDEVKHSVNPLDDIWGSDKKDVPISTDSEKKPEDQMNEEYEGPVSHK